VLRAGDGLDTIFGYQDGMDKFALANGLKFEDLKITQGLGQTVIRINATGESLAALIGVRANIISAEDF
jgi:hypothetical protein